MKVAILAIGDELLNGQTIDTNSAWLGQQLNQIGANVSFSMSVSDTENGIVEGLAFAERVADVILLTGGLGPTKDDITKKVLANHFDDQLIFQEELFERISNFFKRIGRQTTEAHKEQCYLPSKAEMIPNSRGTAPGMWFEKDGKYYLSMPGVPTEMKGIMEEHGLDRIHSLDPENEIVHFIIQTAGLGETRIAEKIKDILETFPPNVSIAYLPNTGAVKLRITGKGKKGENLKDTVDAFGQKVSERLGNIAYANETITLEAALGKLLIDKSLTLGTAESCTGGRIAHLMTSIPGSSRYFYGSVVAYDNSVKQNILGVKKDTLMDHGAVSEATVTEMAKGALKVLGVDVTVAVSGIAGPGGGTPEKPVGTIWIAVANASRVMAKKLQLVKNRELNIRYSSVAALNMVRYFLLEEN